MAEETAAESMETEEKLPQLSLSILQVIRPAQQQNGLKHGDYTRYRQYCKSRLHSLRKTLKLTHGKGKFNKRKLEPHHVLDARYLHIPLVNAERAWAYAMEIKKEIEDKVHKRKRRRHLVSRLSKAAEWASMLSQFSSVRCDTRSAIEAEAYACWMQGNVLFEKESDWEDALTQFLKARNLFQELSKLGDLEQQTYCTQMVEEIDSAIRYCNYSLQRQHGAAPEQAAQLLQLAESQAAKSDLLQSKLAALQQEASRQQLSSSSSSALEWRGQRVNVRNDKIRMSLHGAAELAQQLGSTSMSSKVSEEAQEQELEDRLALYDKMVNAYNEAKGHIRSGLRAATEGDSQHEELQQLDTLLSGTILEHNIQRSTLLLQNARRRFNKQLQAAGRGKGKGKEKERPVKAEDLIRLHDSLIRNLEELSELGSKLGGRQGEALVEKCTTQVSSQLASRCYYVGHAFLSSEKYAQAAALFQRALKRASDALDEAENSMEVDKALISELQALQKEAKGFRLAAAALYRAEQEKAKQSAQKGVENMGLEEQQQQTQTEGWLVDQLEAWQSFAGQGNKNVRIYQPPYPLQTAPVSPIMLDTAFGLIEYPSLEHRLPKKAEQKSTLTSWFTGWRR